MNRFLTTVLSIHWTLVFALLAWSDGAILFGSAIAGASTWLALAISAGFALVAALFLWLLLSVWLDRGTGGAETVEVARIAFAGAALAMTLVVAPAMLHASGPLLTGIALQLAALLSSYLAITTEIRAPAGEAPRKEAANLAARFKALGAARETVLGRPGPSPLGEPR